MIGAAVLAVGLVFAQGGGERITSFDVRVEVEADGDVVVREEIAYDFGFAERRGILRLLPVETRYDDTHDRRYPLTVLGVSSPTAPDRVAVEDAGAYDRIRIGDPNIFIRGEHRYVIEYRYERALNRFADHVELYMNATGNDWDVPIDRTSVSVSAPGQVGRVVCFAGPPESVLPCDDAAASGDRATFSHGALPAGNGVTVVVELPPDAVSVAGTEPVLVERWSLRRAFSITPATVAAALVLLLGSVVLVARNAWHHGRDRRALGGHVDVAFAEHGVADEPVPPFGFGAVPVEFAPPDGLRPGQLGVLVDEVAHPLDVTATIVDLATRGWLRIEQVGEEGWFRKPDWRLVRLRQGGEGLLRFEVLLLEGLFEDGDDVLLSDLKRQFSTRLKEVQEAMYDDAVERHWFRGRPDRVRAGWVAGAAVLLVVVVGLTFLAAARTTWGIVPLGLVPAALLALAVSQKMAARTATGTGVLRRALGFKRFIDESEAHRARFAEQQHLFTEYLPYAVAFGATERWAKAFAGLDTPPPQPAWYAGPPGSMFDVVVFGSALDGFATSTTGTIAASPTPSGSGVSGFGGGGFSGGGFGGGGGGSW